MGQADGFGSHRGRQSANEQFNAPDVVLEVGIGGVELPRVGLPLNLEWTDAGAVGNLPCLVHLVGLVGLERGKFLGNGHSVRHG